MASGITEIPRVSTLKSIYDKFDEMGEKIGINKVANIVQWPAMGIPLNKVIEWRNKDNPNFVKKVTASIACVGLALATLIASIAKLAFGIISLIPPFTQLGMTLLVSTVVFESQVLVASIKTSISSLFYQKVNDFRLDLM